MDNSMSLAAAPAARLIRTAVAVACSVMLLAIMAVTTIDVFGRYVFDIPLKGGTELTELLLVSIIFVGLPAICLDDGHVKVDLITERLPRTLQPLRLVATGLITVGFLAVVGSRLWLYAGQISAYGGTTSSLRIPVAPVAYVCATATFVAAAITLFGCLISRAQGGHHD
ncbi:TRAP transporter small permease [Sulfitobacter sp. F26204]|uniref:TRAP transporter small permease n=1 Tax=Sulfitobacter sp. F26204 TaxID=2996014 RepID=UPI00225E13FB|nr:TRAP transporter small permease [Sulfitobacter sp. F26204]MCX7561726.1 TRAP transporter small permease [Sulfitobacter sp. F26204]